MKLHFYKFLIALALLAGSTGVLNAQTRGQTYNPANIVKEPPVRDKNGLSDKRLVSMTEQLKSNATTIRLGNGVSLRSGLVDLGDGMSLLGTDVDANSTLAVVTVNSNQWANLLDGNNYNFSGELVNITNTVYSKFKDDFDFIFYVLDMPQDNNVINALGFYGINMGVSNNIQGLGMSAYNNTSYWGSAGKLKSVMYFPYADAILFGPTLHELSHNWAAFIVPTYDENNNPFGGHWGISNAGGQLGGFKYVREVEQNSGGVTGKTKYQASFSSNETNPDGSFKYPGFGSFANGGNGLPYSDIELYLMGMKSAQDLRNAGFHLDIYSGNSYDDVNSFYGNGYFYSTTKTSYSIDNIISLVGARVPDASSSQKHFKILTVAISQESAGTHYYSNIITAVNWLAGPQSDQTYYPWLYNFSQATYGAGSLETGGVNSSLKSILPATITLNKTSASITEGQTEQLTATVSSGETPTWSSDNTPVATVSSTGLVTAVSAGNATITATISGGISATCAVTVTAGGSTSPCSNPTASGTTGGLTWTLCPDGILTISGNGPMPDYNQEDVPWYDYRHSITEVLIDNGVSSIGRSAFQDFYNLTSINIPGSVTSIGSYAFFGNRLSEIIVETDNITYSSVDGVLFSKDQKTLIQYPSRKIANSYNIPTSVITIGEIAFIDCTNLTSVSIPNSVTTIGHSAFFGCNSLISLTIPNSVINIGKQAFNHCNNLFEINVDLDNTEYSSIDGIVFNKDHTTLVAYPGGAGNNYEIPNSVTTIGEFAFAQINGLTSITIPNSVTTIGQAAFNACNGLTNVIIPSSVINIDRSAFWYCMGLKSVTILGPTTVINNEVFGYCSSLTEFINYSTSPQTIDASVFTGIELNSITLRVPVGTKILYEAADVWKDFGTIVEQSNTSPCNNPTASGTTGGLTWTLCPDGTLTISGNGPMPDYDWYTTPWNNYKESIANVVISDGVDNISKLAFWNCQNMTAITIPNSVTTIGYYALNQTGLTAITIPNSVTSIGISAFENCNNLTSITIPNSVVNIGIGAFRRCANLNTINADAANPEYLSIDGILFSKDQATLVAYPAGKENNSYDIPTSVNTIGDGAFSGSSNLTSITIPNSVTAINSGAFSECTGLTSVTIPNTVTSIGIVAFSNCANLLSINVDTANPAYLSIDGVLFNKDQTTLVEYPEGKTNDSYVIPTSVTSIYHGAFWSSNLTSITIPASVTSIESVAFISSDKLTDVIVEWTTPLSIPDNVFQSTSISAGTLHVPAGTKALYQAAPVWKDFGTIVELSSTSSCDHPVASGTFGENNTLTWTLCPNGTLTISGTGAMPDFTDNTPPVWNNFRDMITHVVIEEGITSIGNQAFHTGFSYPNLTAIDLPESLESIGFYALGYSGLTSIRIPKNVSNIGSFALTNLSKLEAFEVDAANNYFSVKDGILFSKDESVLIQYPGGKNNLNYSVPEGITTIKDFGGNVYLQSIHLPESITSIDAFGLSALSNLETINLPASLSEISMSLFRYDYKLQSIVLPDNLTAIAFEGFNDCKTLTSINIPESVTSIEGRAFWGCAGLKTVQVNWQTPLNITIDETAYGNIGQVNVFEDVPLENVTLVVPVGSKALYAAADVWKNFGTIVELGETISVTGISLDKQSLTLEINATEQLTATVAPATATNKNLTWSSSNTSVATVTSTGLVTAHAAGSATITVTTNDGSFTATANITVNAARKPGDISGDGTIDFSDLMALTDLIYGVTSLTGDALLAADVNHDGTVDFADLMAILDHIYGVKLLW